MRDRVVQRITVTNDVHSSLADAARMLGCLDQARSKSVVADSGDFFEGDGYYRLGQGRLETEALVRLYDIVVPGNHGYARYGTGPLHRLTVCANVRDRCGSAYAPMTIRIVAGRRVAFAGVLGEQAFAAIPAGERSRHTVSSPRDALMRLHREHQRTVDAWVLLSHSGWNADLELAEQCPYLDVIFSGHCHSMNYGPARVGKVLIAKGAELGGGFVTARPGGPGEAWTVAAEFFSRAVAAPPCSSPVHGLLARIEECTSELARPLGSLSPAFRDRETDRRELLALLAQRVAALPLGADAVLLNEPCLRTIRLGSMLTRADLLRLAPFNSQLVRVAISRRTALNLPTRLERMSGRCVLTTIPRGRTQVSLVTTDYIAENALSVAAVPCGIGLADALRAVLTEATP